jgi:Fe2+ or Zn2+ uptake regulation protein
MLVQATRMTDPRIHTNLSDVPLGSKGAGSSNNGAMSAWTEEPTEIQVEILKLLVKAERPLRPTRIQNLLPERLRPKSSTKLYYHLDKLKTLGLITNEKITSKLSLYGATDAGASFILHPTDEEAKVASLVKEIAPLSNKSKEQLRDAIREWLHR